MCVTSGSSSPYFWRNFLDVFLSAAFCFWEYTDFFIGRKKRRRSSQSSVIHLIFITPFTYTRTAFLNWLMRSSLRVRSYSSHLSLTGDQKCFRRSSTSFQSCEVSIKSLLPSGLPPGHRPDPLCGRQVRGSHPTYNPPIKPGVSALFLVFFYGFVQYAPCFI